MRTKDEERTRNAFHIPHYTIFRGRRPRPARGNREARVFTARQAHAIRHNPVHPVGESTVLGESLFVKYSARQHNCDTLDDTRKYIIKLPTGSLKYRAHKERGRTYGEEGSVDMSPGIRASKK